MTMIFTRPFTFIFAASVAALIAMPSFGQNNFPARPVKIIVPTSPGGDTDIVARLVGDLMSKELKQPVVVENKPGAGALIGVQAIVNAPADGYTIGMVYQAAVAVVPHLKNKMPFDPSKDLVAIGRVATTSNAIIVAHDSQLKDMSDLIALARKRPDAVNYGSWGIGSGGHLAGVLINQQAKVNLQHVPYKGTTEVVQAVMAKEVQVGVVGYGLATTQSKGGNVRVLALLEADRNNNFFPGVPTASESGYPIVQAGWFGLVAPAKTPPVVVAKLESAMLAAVKDPSVPRKLSTLSITTAPLTGLQFAQQIKKDFDSSGPLVDAAEIKKD